MSKWNYGVDKTYRTASEAFRDADYATPIWKCQTDYDRTVSYLQNSVIAGAMAVFLGGTLYLITHFLP